MRQLSLNFLICLLPLSLKFVIALQEGECRILTFPSFVFFADKRLVNHRIKTEQVLDLSFCELLCYYEPNCVSVNFKDEAIAEGTFSCELNNSTHRGHDDEFVDDHGYLYRGSDSACDAAHCENNATCQSGYTHKKHRCLCLPTFTGDHCEKDAEKSYHVTVRTSSVWFAGTNAHVWIRVLGTKGSTESIELDNLEIDDFNKGQTDEFVFQTYHVGTITGVEVYRDNLKAWPLDSPNWHLDYIEIEGQYFYYKQWVEAHTWVRQKYVV